MVINLKGMTKSQLLVLGMVLLSLLGLTLYTTFFAKHPQLDAAIHELSKARQEIQKTQKNLDSILIHSASINAQNAAFQTRIKSLDSLLTVSATESKKREAAYLNSLHKLEKSLNQVKNELAKMNPKMPEPEYGNLEISQ
ncbi:hypothetical protein MASR2M44_28020 [Bacteroidota bacterium]